MVLDFWEGVELSRELGSSPSLGVIHPEQVGFLGLSHGTSVWGGLDAGLSEFRRHSHPGILGHHRTHGKARPCEFLTVALSCTRNSFSFSTHVGLLSQIPLLVINIIIGGS